MKGRKGKWNEGMEWTKKQKNKLVKMKYKEQKKKPKEKTYLYHETGRA